VLTKDQARTAIMREWYALPPSKRRTQDQAVAFALAMRGKYPFRTRTADPYQVIMGWLQSCLGLP
jgi:hypothetical protein